MAWTGFGGGGSSGNGWNDRGSASYTRNEGGWTNSYNSHGDNVGSARTGSAAANAAQAAARGNTNAGRQGSTGGSQGNGGSSKNGGTGTTGSRSNGTAPLNARSIDMAIKAVQEGRSDLRNLMPEHRKQIEAEMQRRAAAAKPAAKPATPAAKPATNTANAQAAAQKAAQAAAQAAAQKAAQQKAAAAKAAADKAAAERAAAAAKAAAEAKARQDAINRENTQRTNLQTQLKNATSSAQVAALQQQIGKLGTLGATAAQNKAFADTASKQFGAFKARETDAAIGGAQATIGQAQGTPVSAAQQAANTAEANRMGGYDTRSTAGKVGDVVRGALAGASIGGLPGALIGAGAETYNSFINNTRGAGSSTQTAGVDATKPTAGNALAGAASGAIKGAGYGSVLGPGGALAGAALGAIWGGATAAGVAPTAEQLRGRTPLEQGQVTNTGSMGPAQQLANGQWVGKGGSDRYTTKPVANVGGNTTPGVPNATGGNTKPVTPNTGTPSTGGNGGNTGTGIDGQVKAGNGAFNQYLQELRKRQLDNLLSTGAGNSRTSGTALLGRVGASQGAIGGLSGYVQSTLGGGKSLLGGAWGW